MKRPREYEYPKGPLIVVGFDCEWTFLKSGLNSVLSWQFVLLNTETRRMTKLIIYPKDFRKSKRITLDYGLSKIIHKARREMVIREIPRSLWLAGHFLRADISALKDYPDLRRQTEAIRKTYATCKIPVRETVSTPEGTIDVNVRLVDTMPLTAAGTPLAKIGADLGIPKVELPEGYSKDRMDLFLEERPHEYEQYALTDALITAQQTARVREILSTNLDITKPVTTLGNAAVELVRKEAKQLGINLNAFLGQEKARRPMPHLVPVLATAAQCYHGGCNMATALGFSPEGTPVCDVDAVSAYTTALAFIQVSDWGSPRATNDLDELAVVEDAITIAYVKFTFPDATMHPCLPVRASKQRGLVYPLHGHSWCTGPELVVARNMGAEIRVVHGYRVDWLKGSERLFEGITATINRIRKQAKQAENTSLDKTVKEVGNSIYGKLAQGIAGTRIIQDDCEYRRTFDTRYDKTAILKPSAISNAVLAAYCTGLVRALLFESVSKLPADRWVGTITTDGFLFTGTVDDLKTDGPVAESFLRARKRILLRVETAEEYAATATKPPAQLVWEEKHSVPRVLVTKTRGTYTIAPHGMIDTRGPVLAKAGYRLSDSPSADPLSQCREWEKRYREREYETFMLTKSLTPLRKQHIELVDLQNEERKVRWNADYDMKRQLMSIHDVDGLITADTRPWQTIDEFEKQRTGLDDWKKAQKRVLKTKADYDDMTAWNEARETRKAPGTSPTSSIPPVASAIVKAMAHRLFGSVQLLTNEMLFGDNRRPALDRNAAFLMNSLGGISVTEMHFKNARRRCKCPSDLTGSIALIIDRDREFLSKWLAPHKLLPEVIVIVEALCAEGSKADCDLQQIYGDALAHDQPSDAGVVSDDTTDTPNGASLALQPIHWRKNRDETHFSPR